MKEIKAKERADKLQQLKSKEAELRKAENQIQEKLRELAI